MTPSPSDPGFTIRHRSDDPGTVIAGFAQFGLAGLTAVDYLADQLELEPVGHVRAEGLPSITPFDQGRPRHPTRLLSRDDLDVTVLIGELFIPPWATVEFGQALLGWVDESSVDELCVLSGNTFPHDPEDHQTFWIATDDYRSRVEDTPISPMRNGFLDGVNAALVERGMTSELAVGVLTTPVHPPAPDAEAALRLLESVGDLYELDVDPEPLKAFSESITSYYEGLAARLEEVQEVDAMGDRMYM